MTDAPPPKPNQRIKHLREARGYSLREVIRRAGIPMAINTLSRMEATADWDSFVRLGHVRGVARAFGISSLELAALALGEPLEEERAQPPPPPEAQALVSLMAEDIEGTRRLLQAMSPSQLRELELAAARLVSLSLEREQLT
jgi:transcriptional regulator with XRE-family HTH domain